VPIQTEWKASLHNDRELDFYIDENNFETTVTITVLAVMPFTHKLESGE